MQNDRPIEDARMRGLLQAIGDTIREQDYAGAVFLINPDEAAFLYSLYTTWNAVVEDETTPLGFRVRARSADLGADRAHALLTGTMHMLCELRYFGQMMRLQLGDLITLLENAGVTLETDPSRTRPVPRLGRRP